MQATALNLTHGHGAKALAALLLLALLLTPACSSFCQAHTCRQPPAGKQDSSCHHEAEMSDHRATGVSAAVAACGTRELQFGLPTSTGNWKTGEAILVSFDGDCLPLARLRTSAFARDGRPETDTGSRPEFHRSVARQFSFDTFVSLRV
jgi:hypothetical protein